MLGVIYYLNMGCTEMLVFHHNRVAFPCVADLSQMHKVDVQTGIFMRKDLLTAKSKWYKFHRFTKLIHYALVVF